MAGAAVREIAEKLVRSDSLPTRGEVEIGGRRVCLTDITVPYRSFVADGDTIVPPAASAAAPNLVGSADSAEIRVPGGHIGLMVGRQAHKRSVPLLIEFIKSRSEEVTSDIDHELVLAATAG
jgi:polyhydroxyalkanoate synthase